MRSISSTVTHRAQEPVDMVYARPLERCLSTSPRHLRLSLGSLSENQHQIPSNTLIELTAPVAFKRFTAEPD